MLGARVIDGRPSRMLAARLSTALSLWRSEPEREMIVSGFEEAGAMAAWLVARGVPQWAITLETAARSTNENLENSRTLCPGALPAEELRAGSGCLAALGGAGDLAAGAHPFGVNPDA